ncbi:MAG: Rid family hydrolase [Sedimentitalea sp.]
MKDRTLFSGGRFEKLGGYARARQVGPFIWLAGTTATEPTGQLHAPGDTYAQCCYIFERFEQALNELGAEMRHIVRTQAFLTQMDAAGDYVRAHGETFEGIFPATAAVEAKLTTPGMMVEIQADAFVPEFWPQK